MIVERLVQNKPKLFDNGEYKVFWVESSNMLLIVHDESGGYTEAATIMGIDPNSGECDQIYVDMSLPFDIEPEMWEMGQKALKMWEYHQSQVNNGQM